MQLLALDTSTECCSAALRLASGEVLLRAVITERSHADLILPMIDGLLREAGVRLAELDGIAFGCGPGAFTGLRIAAGVTQGLAIGAGLPVVPISSLAAVAEQVERTEPAAVVVCNDARMGEVYWATYHWQSGHGSPTEQTPETVTPPDRVIFAPAVRHVAGNALAKYPVLLERARGLGLRVHEGLYPRADAVARLGAIALAAGRSVSADQALPTYVRDDVARPPGGTVTGMS